MPIFKNIYISEPHEHRKTIHNIINTSDIRHIYVSIGGKINNTDSFMNYNNNSGFQMIPSYFSLNSTSQLIIVFDTFTQSEYESCYEHMTPYITPNTHIVLCNQLCDYRFIRKFIPYIIDIAKTIGCMPSNMVICNYVKFKYQPNPIEQRYLNSIPNTIYAILKTSQYKDYIESFYEWFGYNAYLYNFIYKYKYYQLYRGAYSSLNLLYDTIKTIEYDNTYQLCISNPQIINFWHYVYNITNPNIKLTSICEDFINDNKIKVTPHNV